MRIIADLLERAIGRPEVLRTARANRALERWEEAVGSALAPHCEPVHYDRGTVTVKTSGSAYSQEVRMSQERIIAALNELAGESLFKDIRVTHSSSWSINSRD
jgi:predicted nucleic acid-binding Zn ribbon protein